MVMIVVCNFASAQTLDGDMDHDGELSITDITMLINAYLNFEKTPGGGNQSQSHEYVDLALPSGTKWATCNVGANSPEESGDYYAWGEIEPKDVYEWNNYKWCTRSSKNLTKYNTNSYNGKVDSKTVLDAEDDVAHVKWGGSWRMPSDEELAELVSNCTWTWTTQNGTAGCLVTSKTNSKSIFLPAAGEMKDGEIQDAGTYGCIWSSTLCSSSPDKAGNVGFINGRITPSNTARCYGRNIRPVFK